VSAVRRWNDLVAFVNGRVYLGAPGVRDPGAPCDDYLPTVDPEPDWLGLRVTASGFGSCDGDGHYLCVGCQHVSRRGLDERDA
jgi:hypothetical protein